MANPTVAFPAHQAAIAMDRKKALLVLLGFLLPGACRAPSGASAPADPRPAADRSSIEIALPRGRSLHVESSIRVRPGPHFRPALGESGEQGVIVLEGLTGITLDLDQVILNGRPAGTPPDEAFGVGLVIRHCEEVVVRGGSLFGYRVPVLVESSRDVRLDGIEIRGGFAQRLASAAAGPDPADQLWKEGREENGDAWAERWGAGFLLVDSSRVVVENCTVRNAQNGLLALRCESCEITGNDFSYLSGWGIALDRSEHCRVLGNRCDYVARGYLHGRYSADFGAAGILLWGGSSENVIAGNLATHSTCGARELCGGDRRGTGNRWFGNDFSWATSAGIELVGVQDSWLVANRVVGGPGGGVRAHRVRRLAVHGNRIEDILGSGVAILAGAECTVTENRLSGCDHGLQLVGGPATAEGEPRKAEHWIGRNQFRENLQDLVLESIRGVCFWENSFQETEPRVHLVDLRGEGAPDLGSMEVWAWLRGTAGFLPSGRVLDCELSAPSRESFPVLVELRSWRPAPPYDRAMVLDFEPLPETQGLAGLILGEHGPWDPRGSLPRPQASSLVGVLAETEWQSSWFAWDADCDPRGDLERWRSMRYEPLYRARVSAWSDPWGGSGEVRERVGATSFGLVASGTFSAPRDGTYVLTAVSDDGLRVRIDGETVLEDWSWHPARRESHRIILSRGSHEIDLEYFQIDGAAFLSVELALAPDS